MLLPSMQPRQRRIALNEAQFREINESLRTSLASVGEPQASISFVCECGTTNCRDTVDVDVARYEAVRADPRRFLVVPGHDIPSSEDVVERYDGYWIVQKKAESAAIAEAADPRDDD